MSTITIHTIRTEADHETAIQRLLQLAQTPLEKHTDEWEEFHVLKALVKAWEQELIKEILPSDPIDIIRFYMEQNGLRNKMGSGTKWAQEQNGLRNKMGSGTKT